MEHIKLFLLMTFWVCYHCQDYYGCYKLDYEEILTVASHFDSKLLTPNSCSSACDIMGFPFSTIISKEFCFCRQTPPVHSAKMTYDDCIELIDCLAESHQSCGSENSVVFYTIGSSISMTPLSNPDSLDIFQKLIYSYNSSVQSGNVIIKKNNKILGGYLNSTGLAEIYFTKYGFSNLEVTSSRLLMRDSMSDRITLLSPKIKDDVSHLTMDCLENGSSDEYFTCDLTLDKGTSTIVNINYNNGFAENITVHDADLFAFGIKVPQRISVSLNSIETDTETILLYNTFFKFDGTLRAVEIYAVAPGDIELSVYSYTACLDSYSKLKNPTTCANYEASYQFECASLFSKTIGRCSNDQMGAANYYGLSSSAFSAISTETISLNQGYNLIFPFDNTQVKHGWFLGIKQLNARISIDMSGSALVSDYVNTLRLNESIDAAFHVRAFVSRPIILSSFYKHPKSPYKLTSMVCSPILIGPISSNFTIYDKITNLNVITDNGQCIENTECVFTATHLTGNEVTYVWTLPFENVTTTVPELNYNFNKSGSYEIFLLASNPVTNVTLSFNIKVIIRVKNPRLYFTNSDFEASAVGKSSDFLFTIETGLGYACTIDYGDSKTDQFDDFLFNLNNSIFSHTYSAEGVYVVKILCYNSISNDSYQINHLVQHEVTNLRLTKWFSLRNVPFTINFTIGSGSAVEFELWYDGELDSAANFNLLTRTGSSSVRLGASSGLYKVNLTVWNKASRQNLYQDYEIGSKISNPLFLLTNLNQFAPGHYHFGTELNFVVKMSDGANVNLHFFFGDQIQRNVPNLKVNTTGDWNSDYSISYTHTHPGDFVIKLLVFNSFDSFVLNQSVSIVSDVNNLIPGLVEDPVVYSPLGSFAFFIFSYAGNTKSGSHASVTIWPGDTFNQSLGPFPIGMNFNLNSTINSLMYRYQDEGEYKAVFLVQNMLGSKFYELYFTIKQGVYGLFVNFKPILSVGSIFNIETYLLQGENVTYTWTFDEEVKTAQKLSTSVTESDNQSFLTFSEKNASLIVRASDGSSAQILNYLVEIQNPVTNVSILTNPVDTTNIMHDGTARSRTIRLNIQIIGNPTNPFVLIDFGDGNPPENAKYLSGPTEISYTYREIGSYNINITIFNKISSKSFFRSVKILSDFREFKCIPKWRPIPVDGTEEKVYIPRSNGVFNFDKKRDLRLHCTWQGGLVQRFTVNINGTLEIFLDFRPLDYAQLGDNFRIVLPIRASRLVNLQEASETTLKVFYSNLRFQREYSLIVTFFSSIILKSAVEDTSIFAPGSSHTFLVNFETLAEPSCASVRLTDTNYQSTPISIGTSAAFCSLIFPNLAYRGPYDIADSTWRINLILEVEGNLKMTTVVRNLASEQTVSTSVAVTILPCAPPLLSIENRAENFFLPSQIARTKMVILLAKTILRCNLTLSNERKWQLFLVNQTNGNHISQIDLSNNPTEKNSEIVIRPNILRFGLYKFVFNVRMIGSSLLGRRFESSIDTYLRVVPTGIVVWGLKGGVAERRLGMNQELKFTPSKFSFDQDGLVSISSLKFKFYCTVVDSGIVRPYPSRNSREKFDLFSLKNASYPMSSNTTCFDDINGYEFDLSGNSITIFTSYLTYFRTRIYRFMIATTNLGKEYFQEFDLRLEFFQRVPIIEMGCNPSGECKPYSTFQKINPSSQLQIRGNCESGCENVNSVSYSFQIFCMLSRPTVENAWMPLWMPHVPRNSSTNSNSGVIFLNKSHVIGSKTNQMVMLAQLFKLDESVIDWKIDLTVTIISNHGISIGGSSLKLRKNKLPQDGHCTVSPSKGLAMTTLFKISCTEWKDLDGKIARYEYYSVYRGVDKPVSLGYNSAGEIEFELPLGPAFDAYKMYLYVEIIDNDDGSTRFNLETPIVVEENKELMDELMNSISSLDPTNDVNMKLFGGKPQEVLQIVNSITSVLNNQGFGDKNGLTRKTVVGFGPFQGIPKDVNFDNIGSINITGEFVGAPENTDNSTFEEKRQKRAQVRDALITQIKDVSISDMSSLKLWTGVLNTATQSSDELSRSTSQTVADQCINLALALESESNTASLDNIQQVTAGIIGAVSNIVTGLSSSLNGYSSELKKDLDDASVPDDDNDLENFWNNPRNFDSDPSIANLDPIALVNNFKNKFQLIDAIQKSQAVIELTSKILSNRLNKDQSVDINTPTVSMKIEKLSAQDMSSLIYQGFSKINLPNFCDLVAQNAVNNSNSNRNPFFTPPIDPNSCDTKTVVLRTRNEPVAPTGTNGANETKIQDSNIVSLEFVDENSNPIAITKSKNPIDIWIPRNPTLIVEFTYINTSNITLPVNASFLPNGITIDAVNISVFIQIRPQVLDIGYFVWYKKGLTPAFNDTSIGLCPEDVKFVRGDTYYQISINQSTINGFKGFVGFGIREMNTLEFERYCLGNNSFNKIPLSKNQTNFTSDFSLRIFSSACYYFDPQSGRWQSNGVEIMEDSNIHYTHCKSKHLTTFAGGFIVLPPTINFEKVFAQASFANNPTIYITIIVISILFIVLMIIARYMDIQDSKKLGLNLLPDNNPYHDYCYEIMVFTGSRKEAGTDSKVRFILSGENLDTGVRVLSDPRRKIFRRGGIDSFILAVEQPLGALNYLRIWHDNSGEDDYASWYLKFVIIRDLQTKEKAYFLCEKWFAVEKDDGLVDRLFPVATEIQKTNLQYLAQKEAKRKIQDEHLWLSILSRPIQSAFSRMDRVTCCFVLLYITMLMNILYYEMDTSTNRGGLEIGPFMLTPIQVGIGIVTNLITFPPTLLLVYLFRNSRQKTTSLRKLEKKISKNNKNKELKFDDLNQDKITKSEPKNKKKTPGLPWWCKIIAYILSAIFMILCIFFIIIQGINLGDEKVKKWLTSFITSILSSIFLTQPIKIVLTAFVVILICRKSNDASDIEHDADEDDSTYENKRSLNKDSRFNEYRNIEIYNVGKLNSDEMNEARKKRESEVKFWKMTKEVTAYFVFLMLLFTFSYSIRASSSYSYKAQIEKFILGKQFEKIQKVDDVWKWIIDDFAPKIRISKWYNDKTVVKMGGFFDDFSSRIIGYAVLRSHRVKNDSCKLASRFNNIANFCISSYSMFNEEKNDYGYAWSEFNNSYKPSHGMERVYKAFQYRNSDGLPIYSSYSEGGYMYEMRGRLSFIRGNMSLLQQMNWIDRQTRTVFIEFTTFNPNLNLFSISTILFEILPTGNLVKTSKFNVLKLLTTENDAIEIGTGIAYLIVIVYFMIREIVKIFKLKKLYFKQFWVYLQWTLIAFSWAALAMYIYKVMVGQKVKEFFKQTNGYGYIRLQNISYWNEMLTFTIAVCTCLATIKFIKLLRFNSNVIVLMKSIRNSLDDILGITFMMLIWFFAFVFLFYIMFLEKIIGFSTFFKSMSTCFQVLLGKFDIGSVLRESTILGPLFFTLYNLMVRIIIISVFITVISDSFIEVKRNNEAYFIETDLSKYLFDKLKRMVKKTGLVKKKKENNNQAIMVNNYVGETDLLPNRVNKLMLKINEFNNEKLIYENFVDH